MTQPVILTRADVNALLDMAPCIDAVEKAFVAYAIGGTIAPGVLGAHVQDGGFHVKTAGLQSPERSYFVAKVNANFPENPIRRGLPTIQGIIALFDADDGRVLALLDSMEITSVRTAAATAVAAKYLARSDSAVVTICGCGEQARSQLRALSCVRPIRQVLAYDLDPVKAQRFADEMPGSLGVTVTAVDRLNEATQRSDIWVTCTPATRWFLSREHVASGAFVAAVGADNPHKQEIDPRLMTASAVVCDVLEQCATIGDLHHALAAGTMRREDVRAELADVVCGRKRGRNSDSEVVIFDSTGTALQDVAAAQLVYQRALETGRGVAIDLASRDVRPAGS